MAEQTMWTRPSSVPFPSFRKRYVGRRPADGNSDGTPPTYIIQELPDDRHEEAIRLMTDVFLREEPVTLAFGIRDDPEALAEAQDLWRLLLSQRVSLCAMVEQQDGSAGPLAGFNVLTVTRPDNKLEAKNERIVNALKAVKDLEATAQPDVYTRYGVSEYLSAVGLLVVHEHRGQGLGEQLLRARWDLGRALGLHASATMFTGTTSQLLARRVGFQTLAEALYADHADPNLRTITSSPSMIFMGAKLD